MKNKKLLFISFAQGRGGAEEYVVHVLAGANKAGWHCEAAVPFTDADQGYMGSLMLCARRSHRWKFLKTTGYGKIKSNGKVC